MNAVKILAISDLHCYDISELQSIGRYNFDLCVLCGDIPVKAIKIIKSIVKNKPVISVAGNHDNWNTPDLGGAENIHLKPYSFYGINMLGFGGSLRYKQGNYPMFTRQYVQAVRKQQCSSGSYGDYIVYFQKQGQAEYMRSSPCFRCEA